MIGDPLPPHTALLLLLLQARDRVAALGDIIFDWASDTEKTDQDFTRYVFLTRHNRRLQLRDPSFGRVHMMRAAVTAAVTPIPARRRGHEHAHGHGRVATRVRAVKDFNHNRGNRGGGVQQGMEGTVVRVDSDGDLLVRFDALHEGVPMWCLRREGEVVAISGHTKQHQGQEQEGEAEEEEGEEQEQEREEEGGDEQDQEQDREGEQTGKRRDD